MTNSRTSSKLQSCDFSFVLAGVFKLSEPFLEVVVLCKLFLPKTLLHEAVPDEAIREGADDEEAANYQEDRKQDGSQQAGGRSCACRFALGSSRSCC